MSQPSQSLIPPTMSSHSSKEFLFIVFYYSFSHLILSHHVSSLSIFTMYTSFSKCLILLTMSQSAAVESNYTTNGSFSVLPSLFFHTMAFSGHRQMLQRDSCHRALILLTLSKGNKGYCLFTAQPLTLQTLVLISGVGEARYLSCGVAV